MDKKTIKERLIKTICYKCGASLDGANVVPISELPIALTAHVTCKHCQAESMVTITLNGVGTLPVVTDLKPEEIKDFFGQTPVTASDVLEVHKLAKQRKLWNLLQKREQNLVKRAKN